MSRFLLVLPVWVIFVAGYCPNAWDDRQVWFGNDQALLLRAADNVLAGDPPFVGAYSKGSLFHPGPLFSYLLALIQVATRGDVGWTNAANATIQTSTVPVLVLFAQRVTGSWVVALTMPFLIVFSFPFLFYLRIIWNVAIVLPLLSLALWLTWEIESHSARRLGLILLPLLTFILCFLAQVHMAYTPVAVSLGILALARFAWQPRPRRDRWTAIGATALVALACWAPVLWDALRHEGGGNLGALLRHFAHDPRGGHDLWTAWGALHGVGLQALPRAFPLLSALALSTALLASMFWRRDERAMALRWLAIEIAGVWLVALLGVMRIPDAIDLYYLRPLSILVVVHLIGGVAALLLWLRQWHAWPRVIEAAVAVGVIALVTPLAREEWLRFRTTTWNAYPLRELRIVARAIHSDLSTERATARVEVQPPGLAGSADALAYVLRQEGIAPSRAPQAVGYRILAPADRPAGPGSGRELIRTARFRVERDAVSRCPIPNVRPGRRPSTSIARR